MFMETKGCCKITDFHTIPCPLDMLPLGDAHGSMWKLSSLWSDSNWRWYNLCRDYTMWTSHKFQSYLVESLNFATFPLFNTSSRDKAWNIVLVKIAFSVGVFIQIRQLKTSLQLSPDLFFQCMRKLDAPVIFYGFLIQFFIL